MKTGRTAVFWFLSILFPLSLIISSSAEQAQRLEERTTIQTFPVGDQPDALTFDGANVWVANSLDDTVTKLRASDGAPQGIFAVGDFPQWITFDGTNVWVSNTFSDNVTKLLASDGTVLGTFAVGDGP